jgi:hypothetical protein
MLSVRIRKGAIYLSFAWALAAFAGDCSAQIVAGGQQPGGPQQAAGGGPILFPGLNGQLPGAARMSPQQVQNIMMMRALQMRGRHQVRTGIPQDIQMGPQGSMGPMMFPQVDDTSTSRKSSTQTRKSSTEKRAEARALRDEQKRAAREEAKAKKAKTKKVKAADQADAQ